MGTARKKSMHGAAIGTWAWGWLAALAIAPVAAGGDLVVTHDHRHVELSANGEAGAEVCATVDAIEAEMLAPSVEGTIECATAATLARAAARVDTEFFSAGMRASGVSSAIAEAIGESAASAFGTAHFIVEFEIEGDRWFRLTGLLATMGGACHLRLTDHHGVVIFDAETHHGDLPRATGMLHAGEYRLEIEAASEASTAAGRPSVEAAFRARLELAVAPLCDADVDGDGVVTPEDFAMFVSAYFGASEHGAGGELDLDRSGAIDPDDLGDFINAYFGGCG